MQKYWQTFNFLVKTKNVPNGLKCKINDIFFSNKGFPKGGDGGSATWEKFPNNPVIFFESFPESKWGWTQNVGLVMGWFRDFCPMVILI